MVTYRSHACTALALSTLAASAFFPQDGASAAQATTTTCTNQPQPAGPSYAVQRNEWSSGAAECVATDGGPDFSVTSSAISNATDGAPGAYSFIYSGCFLGSCTPGVLALDPPQLKDLTRGSLTTGVSASTASGIYNTAYDIWTATQPDTSQPVTGTEVMIWLNRQGPIQPAGYLDLSGVTIDGTTYDVWLYPHPNHIGNTVTFLATSGMTSMSGVDVYDYLQYVLNQGWASPDYYLTSVDAGFEIWQGGAGLRVNNFSVSTSVVPQSAKAPAKPAATHTLGLDFGPGVKTVKVCGTHSAGGGTPKDPSGPGHPEC
jgi:hypothetical protein